MTRALLTVAVFLGALGVFTAPAPAANLAGEWDAAPPALKEWFRGVRSPRGVPCCSVADGHATDYEARVDGRYWVPIEGEWRPVPPEAVVLRTSNPTRRAVVWWVRNGQSAGGIFIRCFVSDAEN